METVLEMQKVSVSFNGFLAVKEMDFNLSHGELRFLIGPNGAGKTTLLDLICGKTRPTSGKIKYLDEDLTRMKEHQIAKKGIGRKFQAPSIFSSLTVSENLELAMRQKRDVFSTLFARSTKEERVRIEEQAELIGLSAQLDVRAGSLSHGEKQWLEIGMMLFQEPRVLLLDEPVAGMTDTETVKTGELLQRVLGERSIVVVEHDMEFVRSFAKVVTVMHEGQLLKEGTMQEVQNDQRVAEVYLGRKAG